LLPPDHELVVGTLRKIESNMSPGGIPIHTGWLADGMWVAIALDNVAEVHLVRHEGDIAARYLYATLNHGTPLVTWCEERGPEPGSAKCTGDRQHLWTPVAVVRAVRDCLVMEQGDTLQLALGTARHWLGGPGTVGVENAATHFGPVSYALTFDREKSQVTGNLKLDGDEARTVRCRSVVLNVRLPGGLRLKSVDAASGATVSPDGSALVWKAPRGARRFTATVSGQ
jgi:hypothetical protein